MYIFWIIFLVGTNSFVVERSIIKNFVLLKVLFKVYLIIFLVKCISFQTYVPLNIKTPKIGFST